MHKQAKKARNRISQDYFWCFIETCFCCRKPRSWGKPSIKKARRRLDKWVIEEELEDYYGEDEYPL